MNDRITAVVAAGMLLAALLAGRTAADSARDYWPAWRGPLACGVSPTAQPPVTWSETRNVKRKVAIPGQGTSSPVVWGDKIFFLTAIMTDRAGTPTAVPRPDAEANAPASLKGSRPPGSVYQFDVVCLDRITGRILWEKTAREEAPHEGHSPEHGFASYSPVTDGVHVWAGFGSRGVHCYDVNGVHQWSRDLGRMTTKLMWGEASSPILAGDALIVVMDHEAGSSIQALDKTTGRTLWKRARVEDTAWATPVVAEVNGRAKIIVAATKRIRSYDLQTGDPIWECSGQTENVIPSPIAAGGLVYCTSGARGGEVQAIELGHTGDLTGTKAVRWQVSRATPYVPSPLLYDGKLYICFMNRAAVSCYDAATGRLRFTEENLAAGKDLYASPVGAAGRVYIAGRNGATAVIRNSDGLEILAANKLDDGFDASPAVAGHELFLKGKKNLYCISER